VLSVLDAKGKLASGKRALDDDDLLRLFRAMVVTRAFDERALHLQRTGRIPAYYPCAGMEASAGAALALRPEDWVFSAYREQPIRLARGVPVIEELANWKGAIHRAWNPMEHRITPMTGTIGTHITHATGFACGARLQGRDEVAMAVFGDGATSENDFHAGLNFAGVWRAPVVFFCQNNQYAQSTPLRLQTASETLADKATAYGFPGVRVDGMDALAVHQAVSEAIERAVAGDGPTLIESVTYRYDAHSTYDGTPVYRTREEEDEWRARDPLDRMRSLLRKLKLLPEGFEDDVGNEVTSAVDAAIEELEAAGIPPRENAFRHMYSSMPRHLVDQLHEDQRVAGEPLSDVVAFVRDAPGPEPEPEGERKRMSLVDAVNAALLRGMESDERLVMIGEDVGLEGGVFRVTAGLQERFGIERVIDTPLSETGIAGTAVGMAAAGLKPIVEIEFAGFMNMAFDQIAFHAARYRWRTGGAITTPMVIRMPGGGGHEGYEGHSDAPESYFVHTPGLLVVYPSNPYDAKGLMASALEADDPVVFFEPISQYFVKQDGVPANHYSIPIGKAKIIREGTDLSLIAYGNAVHVADAAADRLAEEGISAEVIDLRTLKPWDQDAVLTSVAKTGRLVVCQEAVSMGGFGAEVVATVSEKGGYLLETPPARVGHPDLIWGQAKLEQYSLLTPERICDAAFRVTED
jgi:2-oxoisovalerate dehydrogenase E1 component